MNPTPFAVLFFAGCDDHGRDHDHDAAPVVAVPSVVEAPAGAVAPGVAPAEAALGLAPAPFAVGAYTARLEATAQGVRLLAEDAGGVAVVPSGEARIVLTGTGEAEQRVILQPGVAGWEGSAKAAGALGYVAVVSLEVGGRTETARVTWGEVPAVAPAAAKGAAKAEDHTHEGGNGHDHGHGH